MIAFAHHFAFEFRTGVRNKNLLLLNYLFPLGMYAMMGLIMVEINPSFREVLIPAMVTFAVLAATLLGLPDPLVNARETGILRSFRINGVPARSVLAIPALTTAVHVAIVGAIITASAPLLFDAPPPGRWGAYILTFAAITFACAGIGALVGVISPSTRVTVLWSQLVFVPSMLLGGLMMPYSILPAGVARFARILPAAQAMNALRGLAMGEQPDFDPIGSLIVLALTGALCFALALYLFSWDRRNAKARGHPLMALLVLLPGIVSALIGA